MAAVSISAALFGALGGLAAASELPAAATGSRDALYVSAGGVLVALIGGVVAIITSRNKPAPAEPSPIRFVEQPTSHALPAALVDLYEDALERAVKAEQELQAAEQLAEMWKARALDPGWSP